MMIINRGIEWLVHQTGCHRIPERSFFLNGKQFPVCARCTGVLLGNITAYILFFIHTLSIEFYVVGCAVMFVDWFVQYIELYPSNNIRRLITGVIGGYSLASLYCMAMKFIIQHLIKL